MIAADRLVKLPDAIDAQTAAAMMLQGMTAQYLIRRTHAVQPGETIVVHAAAGGVGLILCQWAQASGRHGHRRRLDRREGASSRASNGAAHAIVGYADLPAAGQAHHRRRDGAGRL